MRWILVRLSELELSHQSLMKPRNMACTKDCVVSRRIHSGRVTYQSVHRFPKVFLFSRPFPGDLSGIGVIMIAKVEMCLSTGCMLSTSWLCRIKQVSHTRKSLKKFDLSCASRLTHSLVET